MRKKKKEDKKTRNYIKIMPLCVTVFLGMLCFFAQEVHAQPAEELTLNIHYFRYNEDYEDWSLWLWKDNEEGSEYTFSNKNKDGWVSTRVTLKDIKESPRIGVLMKYKDWESKDTEEDRYLDLSQAENGVLDVYFIQGEQQIFYGEKQIKSNKQIIRASYSDLNQISFTLYCPHLSIEQVQQLAFSMETEKGQSLPLKELNIINEGNLFYVTGQLENSVDLSMCNYIAIDGEKKKLIEAGTVFSTKAFEEAYSYDGDDLGAIYTKEATSFRVWAPTASRVEVNLYKTGHEDDFLKSYSMKADEKGTWYLKLEGDYAGVYYTYSVTVLGETKEAVDPYAKACGVNGMRGMVIDLEKTNPQGFLEETKPELTSFRDIILYEMSVRDYTMDENSGVLAKGKYLGLTEEGTVNSKSEATALDYLGNLGITHVHLLPSQDFDGVDEEYPEESYNWGYMPQNYNIPEGSYSTDPYNGEVRVNEYKQMVQSLHSKGIRVIMDVVYNHTSNAEESNFNKIVPGYYYRISEDGTYSDGSACGNEVATERFMARKFIVDSVLYWVNEYHVDGFRFDLMGLIDMETMNIIREELNRIDESIFVYGEGWTGGDTISTEVRAEGENAKEMSGISVFSNVFRRGIQNYVSSIFAEEFTKNSVLFGVVAATQQEITKESMGSWTKDPTQCINYASCHDGFTLWDLIRQNCMSESEEMWQKRNKLSAAIVMTVQGIPFIQSGEEMLRSKVAKDDPERIYSNSYNANDYVNSIKWDNISEYSNMVSYYKGLMEFRKNHKGLSYETAEEIKENMKFLENLQDNVIGYTVIEEHNLILENEICMIYNPRNEETSLLLPKGTWKVFINGEQAGVEELAVLKGGNNITVPALEPLVLVRTYVKTEVLYGALSLGAMIIMIVGIYIIKRRKQKVS